MLQSVMLHDEQSIEVELHKIKMEREEKKSKAMMENMAKINKITAEKPKKLNDCHKRSADRKKAREEAKRKATLADITANGSPAQMAAKMKGLSTEQVMALAQERNRKQQEDFDQTKAFLIQEDRLLKEEIAKVEETFRLEKEALHVELQQALQAIDDEYSEEEQAIQNKRLAPSSATIQLSQVELLTIQMQQMQRELSALQQGRQVQAAPMRSEVPAICQFNTDTVLETTKEFFIGGAVAGSVSGVAAIVPTTVGGTLAGVVIGTNKALNDLEACVQGQQDMLRMQGQSSNSTVSSPKP